MDRNCSMLLINLHNLTEMTNERFKMKLDCYLKSIPDEPTVYAGIDQNSLLAVANRVAAASEKAEILPSK